MFKAIFHFLFRKISPIHHAKFLGVKLGRSCRLIDVKFSSEPYLVTLGDHVSATSTRFETHDGGVWVFRDKSPDIEVIAPIVIGNNVFIGYGCIILPGTTIGDNVVIGASSVVRGNIPANSVVAGVPARLIKTAEQYLVDVLPRATHTKTMTAPEKREFFEKRFRNEL